MRYAGKLNEELGIECHHWRRSSTPPARVQEWISGRIALLLPFREYKGELETGFSKICAGPSVQNYRSLDFLEADLQLVRELAEGRIASAT